MSKFNKHKKFIRDKNDKITGLNTEGYKNPEKAFELFKESYDTHYGSINIDDNLISIHTGGWSDNEYLISEFKQTIWWSQYHEITARGGHYYFNIDPRSNKEWIIQSSSV